jgi:hypothetical protein
MDNSKESAADPNPESRSSDLPRTFAAWLAVFGPGAVIASLTIGAGELIFSTRAGALFGYRLLWFFGIILLLKWTLVFTTARHMVLTGAHPFQRWMELPGPRGWLPMVLFILGLVCFPVWTAFHAGTTGTLLASLTGSQEAFDGASHYVWGLVLLAGALVLACTGGYSRLEKIQIVLTLAMLLSVVISVFLLKPDWIEVVKGILIPQPVEYPTWLLQNKEFLGRPVWLETITYVGIIGGSGYDYLAYVSYIREKRWGQAGQPIASRGELEKISRNPSHVNRQWVRGVTIDCTLSFIAVLVFAAVFVICGAMVLQPQHKIPGGMNLLTVQAAFVTPVYPWLKSVYFLGAILAMSGTLYGTIEVAPTVLREMFSAMTASSVDDPRLQLALSSARFWQRPAGFGRAAYSRKPVHRRARVRHYLLVGALDGLAISSAFAPHEPLSRAPEFPRRIVVCHLGCEGLLGLRRLDCWSNFRLHTGFRLGSRRRDSTRTTHSHEPRHDQRSRCLRGLDRS